MKNEYGATPQEILNLLNEKDDMIIELNQYDIAEMLPVAVVERLETILKTI